MQKESTEDFFKRKNFTTKQKGLYRFGQQLSVVWQKTLKQGRGYDPIQNANKVLTVGLLERAIERCQQEPECKLIPISDLVVREYKGNDYTEAMFYITAGFTHGKIQL